MHLQGVLVNKISVWWDPLYPVLSPLLPPWLQMEFVLDVKVPEYIPFQSSDRQCEKGLDESIFLHVLWKYTPWSLSLGGIVFLPGWTGTDLGATWSDTMWRPWKLLVCLGTLENVQGRAWLGSVCLLPEVQAISVNTHFSATLLLSIFLYMFLALSCPFLQYPITILQDGVNLGLLCRPYRKQQMCCRIREESYSTHCTVLRINRKI